MNPAINSALKRCGAVPVSDEDGEDGFLRWIDGYNQRCPDDPSYQKPLSEIGGAGFRGCRRDQFLQELAKNLPPGSVAFGKRLECLEKREEDGIVVMKFADGTKAEAHAGTSQFLLPPLFPCCSAVVDTSLSLSCSHRLRWRQIQRSRQPLGRIPPSLQAPIHPQGGLPWPRVHEPCA